MTECCSPQTIYSFFGPPGSGKGTLAETCKRKLNFLMLSTGNLCRKHVALETDFGKMLNEYLSAGRLIPDELITEMVKEWVLDNVSKQVPIILDGFPRTGKQAEAFLLFLKESLPSYAFRVISFEISEDAIIERLTKRMVCENKSCQAVYSTIIKPKKEGVCDYCGGMLVKRDDDREEVIRERLKYFPTYKQALFSYYDSAGLPIEKLDVEPLNPQEVFDKFRNLRHNNSISDFSVKKDTVLSEK